jgi:hypothetical protein
MAFVEAVVTPGQEALAGVVEREDLSKLSLACQANLMIGSRQAKQMQTSEQAISSSKLLENNSHSVRRRRRGISIREWVPPPEVKARTVAWRTINSARLSSSHSRPSAVWRSC